MKKIIATLVAGTLLTLFAASCNNRPGKKELGKANNDLKEAISETNKAAKAQAAAEWAMFKYAADTTLARLEIQVNEAEKNLAKTKTKNRAALQEELNKNKQTLKTMQNQLKEKNKEFNKEMRTFDQAVYDRNKAFQQEFDHDMKELGTAFLDLFKDNVK